MRHAHQPAVLHYDQDINTRKIMYRPRRPLRRCGRGGDSWRLAYIVRIHAPMS